MRRFAKAAGYAWLCLAVVVIGAFAGGALAGVFALGFRMVAPSCP